MLALVGWAVLLLVALVASLAALWLLLAALHGFRVGPELPGAALVATGLWVFVCKSSPFAVVLVGGASP